MFTYPQRMDILMNFSISYGMSQNFKESVRAQFDMMAYINKLNSHDSKLMLDLLKPYIENDDCVHGKGSRIQRVFIKYWFMLLETAGIKRSETALRYIPRVYGKELNDVMVIKSDLFLNYDKGSSEKYKPRMNYFFMVSKGSPHWVSKMGVDNTYSGINLIDFSFSNIYIPKLKV
jgi:hypothetical protein